MGLIVKFLDSIADLIPLILIVIIVKYYFGKRRLFILGNRLPGPRPWPVLRNALEFADKDLDFLKIVTKFNEKYGLVALWLGHTLHVYICTSQDAETFFTSPNLLDAADNYELLAAILGKGLATVNGIEWKKGRKFIEPAFRYSSLQNFNDIFVAQANILHECLQKEEGKQTFNVYPYVERCTLDIICESTMPLGLNAQHEDIEILEEINEITAEIGERFFTLWQQFDSLYKLSEKGRNHFKKINRVKNFFESKIKEKKKLFQKCRSIESGNNSEKKILLEHFFENEEWNDDLLRDHVLTILGAGYETTSVTITFILMMLGIHKDVQEKLHNEIGVNLKKGLSEKELHRLQYLEMVIKETLRLYPTSPHVFRKASQDVQIGKNLIPKGATVAVSIFAIHRNPKVYENPQVFNPDNFLPENIRERHLYSFLPFGAGIRKCLGLKFAMMSMGIIVSKIVMKYKIECDLKMEDVKVRDHVTLKMESGMYPIRLIKR